MGQAGMGDGGEERKAAKGLQVRSLSGEPPGNHAILSF